MARADCIVLTRTDEQTKLSLDHCDTTEELSDKRPIFRSRMRTYRIAPVGGETLEQVSSIQEPVAAFCGVGNPQSFFEHLRREGFDLALERAFPDHYNYNQADVDQIVAEARRKGAVDILTTAKDAVKLSSLQFELPCYVLEIRISVEDEAQLIQMIRDQLKQHIQILTP